MPVEAPPELAILHDVVAPHFHAALKTGRTIARTPARSPSQIAVAGAGFLAIWFLLYGLWISFPFLSGGSDVVFHAKIQVERRGEVFHQRRPGQRKLLIFGTSKILAGFIPRQFDEEAAQRCLQVFSFNSGYPARDSFVPELKMMTESGTIPDVLLLTEAWGNEPAPTVFNPIPKDYVLAEMLFPFRHLLRDSLSFAANARQHGGVTNYYRLARQNVEQMMKDRGYYFIAEQSHYPQDRLPDGFSQPTDNPGHVAARVANAQSAQGAELRELIAKYRMTCFYVPAYARSGAVAPAPRKNVPFELAAQALGCGVLGPDYFSYPNSLFSDEIHLNREGARVFTEDLSTFIQGAIANSSHTGAEHTGAVQ